MIWNKAKKLSEYLDTTEKRERLSHLKNLIALAHADGQFTDSEAKAISLIATRMGIEHGEMERLMERPDSIDFVPPKKISDRVNQIHQLLLLVLVDGNVNDNEINFCIRIGEHMGLDALIVLEMLAKILKVPMEDEDERELFYRGLNLILSEEEEPVKGKVAYGREFISVICNELNKAGFKRFEQNFNPNDFKTLTEFLQSEIVYRHDIWNYLMYNNLINQGYCPYTGVRIDEDAPSWTIFGRYILLSYRGMQMMKEEDRNRDNYR